MTKIRTSGAIALSLAAIAFAASAQDADERAEEAIGTFEPSELDRIIAEPDIAATGGEAIYQSVCAGCHMPDGEGAVGAGAYPALSGNPNLEFPDYPVFVVVNGQRAMPGFAELLDNEQVAEVVNFIQSNLGNDYEPTAEPALVEQVRPADTEEGLPEEHE